MLRNEVRLTDCLKNYTAEVEGYISDGVVRATQVELPQRLKPCTLAGITDPVRLSVTNWLAQRPVEDGTGYLRPRTYGFESSDAVAYVGLHDGYNACSAIAGGAHVLLCPQWPENAGRAPRALWLEHVAPTPDKRLVTTQFAGRSTLFTALARLGLDVRCHDLLNRVCAADPILQRFTPRELVLDNLVKTILSEALDALEPRTDGAIGDAVHVPKNTTTPGAQGGDAPGVEGRSS